MSIINCQICRKPIYKKYFDYPSTKRHRKTKKPLHIATADRLTITPPGVQAEQFSFLIL